MQHYRYVSFFLLTLFAGCGAAKSCPARTFSDAQMLVGQLARQQKALGNIRAAASVDQWDEGGRIRGKIFLMVDRPAKLRVDIVSQFGSVASLSCDGTTVAVNDKRKQRFQSGPACPANIARLIGAKMQPSQLVSMLLGELQLDKSNRTELQCGGKSSYSLTALQPDGVQYEAGFDVLKETEGLSPDKQVLIMTAVVVSRKSKVLWSAEYSDFKPVKGPHARHFLPFRVRYKDPNRKVDTLLRFENIEVNIDLPESAFRQSALPGFSPQKLLCPNP